MKDISSICCNGNKVRELRKQQGMTQEKLAAMSNVNHRTVQRAEKGQPIQLETIASLAAALRVTMSAIRDTPESTDQAINLETAEGSAVVLRHISSGKALLDMLHDSFSGSLFCQAEPTSDNVDALSAVVEKLEGFIPNPWEIPMDRKTVSLAERLRESVALSLQLSELEKVGISLFAGTYTAMSQIPQYDMEEGCMCIKMYQKCESVTVCRIALSQSGLDRMTLKVDDVWQEPEPQKSMSEDDIPF